MDLTDSHGEKNEGQIRGSSHFVYFKRSGLEQKWVNIVFYTNIMFNVFF